MASKRRLCEPTTTTADTNRLPQSNICKVCGDQARINNYGILSCQSCKTFFRRNGLHPEFVRLCQFNGKCDISRSIKHKCTSCRLEKCFSAGMSSDLIRKEILPHEKTSSRRKVKKSQEIPQLEVARLDRFSIDQSLITATDRSLFSNVMYAYNVFSLLPMFNCIVKNSSPSTCDINFDALEGMVQIGNIYKSIELFIGSTPDFQVLSMSEQRSLFERNLRGIGSFCTYVTLRDAGIFNNAICYRSYERTYGLQAVTQSHHVTQRLDLDSTLFKFMYLINAFASNCFIVDYRQNTYVDSFLNGTYRLFGSQNVYIELLWKYMIHQYGYDASVLRFTKLVGNILEMIRSTAMMHRDNEIHNDFVDDIIEKTQETLRISQHETKPLWGKTLKSD